MIETLPRLPLTAVLPLDLPEGLAVDHPLHLGDPSSTIIAVIPGIQRKGLDQMINARAHVHGMALQESLRRLDAMRPPQ